MPSPAQCHPVRIPLTWRRFDQSAKQLIVGHTTMKYDDPWLKVSHSDCALVRYFQPRFVTFECRTHYRASAVYCLRSKSLTMQTEQSICVAKMSSKPSKWQFDITKLKRVFWRCISNNNRPSSSTGSYHTFYDIQVTLTTLATFNPRWLFDWLLLSYSFQFRFALQRRCRNRFPVFTIVTMNC